MSERPAAHEAQTRSQSAARRSTRLHPSRWHLWRHSVQVVPVDRETFSAQRQDHLTGKSPLHHGSVAQQHFFHQLSFFFVSAGVPSKCHTSTSLHSVPTTCCLMSDLLHGRSLTTVRLRHWHRRPEAGDCARQWSMPSKPFRLMKLALFVLTRLALHLLTLPFLCRRSKEGLTKQSRGCLRARGESQRGPGSDCRSKGCHFFAPVSRRMFMVLVTVFLAGSTCAPTVKPQVHAWPILSHATHVLTATWIPASTSVPLSCGSTGGAPAGAFYRARKWLT